MEVKKNYKPKILLLVSLIALIIFGTTYIMHTWYSNMQATSAEALKIATVSEITLNGEMFKQLRAVPEDVGTIAYESIKKRLMSLLTVDKEIRFAYIYTKKENKLYFLADSEPLSSKDYSPPGQEYTEADEQYFKPFIDGQALITKPVSDRWGSWISVLVPMKDLATGEIKAVFGIDYPAANWNNTAIYNTAQAGFIILVIFILILTGHAILIRNFKIAENEKNFRNFFKTIDDMIIVGDKQGKILYANDALSQKLGYSQEELLGMKIIDLNDKNKRKEAERIFNDMASKKINSCPLPLEKKDGTLLPAETHVWFGRWDGQDCIFGISKDITAEQESLQKLTEIFENNPTAMALSSLPDRKLVDVNKVYSTKIGYTKDEIVGKTSADLKIFVQPEKQKIIADEVAKNGFVHNVDLLVRTKSGKILNGVLSGETIEIQGKKYFLSVMLDQTERKQIEEEIIKKNKELEKINKFMIDREFKMMELKKEIERLKKQQDK